MTHRARHTARAKHGAPKAEKYRTAANRTKVRTLTSLVAIATASAVGIGPVVAQGQNHGDGKKTTAAKKGQPKERHGKNKGKNKLASSASSSGSIPGTRFSNADLLRFFGASGGGGGAPSACDDLGGQGTESADIEPGSLFKGGTSAPPCVDQEFADISKPPNPALIPTPAKIADQPLKAFSPAPLLPAPAPTSPLSSDRKQDDSTSTVLSQNLSQNLIWQFLAIIVAMFSNSGGLFGVPATQGTELAEQPEVSKPMEEALPNTTTTDTSAVTDLLKPVTGAVNDVADNVAGNVIAPMPEPTGVEG